MTDELKLNMAEKLTAIVGKDRVLVDEAMSRHTTFKIGGNAKILVQISSEDEIMITMLIITLSVTVVTFLYLTTDMMELLLSFLTTTQVLN